MKKIIIRTLAAIGAVVVVLVVVVVAFVWLMNKADLQDRLLNKASDMLAEKLETQVQIDSIRVGFFKDAVQLYGIAIDDQANEKLLQVGELDAEVSMVNLLKKEVAIEQMNLRGVKAHINKPSPDSVANFQFILDALMPGGKVEARQADGKKVSLAVNLKKLDVSQMEVEYNDQTYTVDDVRFIKDKKGGMTTVYARGVQAAWEHETKKGLMDTEVVIGALTYAEKDGVKVVNIDSLWYKTDNHRPHKREGRPKRGYFDAGHLNVVANLQLSIAHASKDSVVATILRGNAKDLGSGLDITALRGKIFSRDGVVHVSDATVSLPNTTLSIPSADITLPNKKTGARLYYTTSTIMGKTVLSDISQPFAPALKDFMLPLQFSTRMSGGDDTIHFSSVLVSTPDNKLKIRAAGRLEGLQNGRDFQGHFDVYSLMAAEGTKERVINQFQVKKFMMEQLHALGNIYYTGSFDLQWKKEVFRGLLRTRTGNMNFQFAIDDYNKYLSGSVRTDSFLLGSAINMPDIGQIACKADFRFDISKARTALVRHKKGGKLPIGQLDAVVSEAKYKFVKLHNVEAHIVSDGALADGNINVKGKHMDVLCSFAFTNTNEMSKMRIKPGIKFHKLTDEAREERDLLRQQKAEQRDQLRQQEQQQEELEHQQRMEKRQAKAARKAAEREQRAAERELRRQQHAAEKELRRQQKALEREEKRHI